MPLRQAPLAHPRYPHPPRILPLGGNPSAETGEGTSLRSPARRNRQEEPAENPPAGRFRTESPRKSPPESRRARRTMATYRKNT